MLPFAVVVVVVVPLVTSDTETLDVAPFCKPLTFTVRVLSAGPLFCATVRMAEPVLLAVFESVDDAVSVAVAVFVIDVPADAFTIAAIVRVAVELALISPIVQVPVEVAYEPFDVVAETKVRPDGNISVATTPVDVAGPFAETVTV